MECVFVLCQYYSNKLILHDCFMKNSAGMSCIDWIFITILTCVVANNRHLPALTRLLGAFFLALSKLKFYFILLSFCLFCYCDRAHTYDTDITAMLWHWHSDWHDNACHLTCFFLFYYILSWVLLSQWFPVVDFSETVIWWAFFFGSRIFMRVALLEFLPRFSSRWLIHS